MNVEEIIMNHVKASGPVSFESIVEYVRIQHGPQENWEIVSVMNQLFRDNKIELYDTGDSFVTVSDTI